MLPSELNQRDQVAQGRLIILGAGVALIMVWVLEFLASPVRLVPGFLYDSSLETAFHLALALLQYAAFTIFTLLLLAGLPVVRFIFAFILMTIGLSYLILSIDRGAFGGAELMLSAICLASAAAMTFSVAVVKFQKDRRARGVPWLGLAVGLVCATALLATICFVQFGRTYIAVQKERQATAAATELIDKFSPSLDLDTIRPVATDHLKENIQISDTADFCEEAAAKLGKFQDLEELPRPTLATESLDPRIGDERVYTAHATYEKGDLYITIALELQHHPAQVNIFELYMTPRRDKSQPKGT